MSSGSARKFLAINCGEFCLKRRFAFLVLLLGGRQRLAMSGSTVTSTASAGFSIRPRMPNPSGIGGAPFRQDVAGCRDPLFERPRHQLAQQLASDNRRAGTVSVGLDVARNPIKRSSGFVTPSCPCFTDTNFPCPLFFPSLKLPV